MIYQVRDLPLRDGRAIPFLVRLNVLANGKVVLEPALSSDVSKFWARPSLPWDDTRCIPLADRRLAQMARLIPGDNGVTLSFLCGKMDAHYISRKGEGYEVTSLMAGHWHVCQISGKVEVVRYLLGAGVGFDQDTIAAWLDEAVQAWK